MRIKMSNDFHGTRRTLIVAADGTISIGQARACWRALCGYRDCLCGGELGERGPQLWGRVPERIDPIYGERDRIIGYRLQLW
ncbi:MAG: hypothetical protein L0191_19950 [Acidobacteria bacterium]|nr:hypothetical protein [Acidobacteriota bacterium]